MDASLSPRHKRISRWILIIISVISLASLYISKDTRFDYDFESFFPKGDKDLDFYLHYRQQFGYDNEFVLIGLENKKGVFQHDFLKKVNELSDSLAQLPNIIKVISPTHATYKYIGPMGVFDIPYLQIDSIHSYPRDSAIIFQSKEMMGTLFAQNGRSLCIFIKTAEGISKKKSDALLLRIESLMKRFTFDNTHIAGKLKAQYVYVERIQKEFVLFLFTSLLLIILFLYLSFRSFWGIWIPITVVLLSILWLIAFMAIMGKPLDLMTVLLPTMIFVVGMSDVVHITTKYLEELREGHNKMQAFRNTIRDVALPTFLTLLTTAIGFLTLLYSNIKPLRDFGIYTSVGVCIAFLLAFTFLPSVILHLKKPLVIKGSNESLFWNKKLHRLFLFILKRRKLMVISFTLVSLVAGYGISRIRINNHLLEDIANSDQLKQDFNYFEEEFSGVRPFELAVAVTDSNQTLFSDSVLMEMERLENFCEKHFAIGFIVSPVTVVKGMNKAMNNASPIAYALPQDEEDKTKIKSYLFRLRKNKELQGILSSDFKSGRISGKMKDIGSAQMKILNTSFEEWLKSANIKHLNIHFTGAATLMDKNNEYLTGNMVQGILMSIAVVALIIALIYRSVKIVIISIIPNIIPILIMGGLMGYTGLELKVSTSIIFSIAFGIATDDTIHFLARLKLELDKGKTLLYAIKRTYISTGKAVVVTSLILSAGFLSLVLSDFQSTFYFGLLISLTLVVAVFTDLLLLPILLLWLGKGKAKK